MSAHDERQLARLRARFYEKAQELSELDFLMRGTILERFKRCGSSGCACHTDPARMHGPYWQWTAKVEGKTVTRVLSEDQVERYRAWMDNAQRLDRVVSELFDLSAQADEVLKDLEREAASPKKQKQQKKKQRPTGSGSRSRS